MLPTAYCSASEAASAAIAGDFFFKIPFLAFLLLSLQIVGFLLVLSAMEFMFVLVVALRRFQILFYGLHVFHIICLAVVAHHLFLLQVPISSCSLEVLVRGCKCKRAIQTATVWLVGFKSPGIR